MSSSKKDEAISQLKSKELITSSDSKTLRLKDPLAIVPEELLSHLLFPLSPSSTAASSAVCRAWRDLILSDSTLHTEIDLSKIESRWKVFPYVKSLSAKSHNKVSKVSLNLSSFWEDHGHDEDYYDWMEEEDEKDSPANLDSLLECLQLSKATLKEISVRLRDIYREDYGREDDASRDALPFLTLLLQPLFKDFANLKKISIIAPSYITVKAGKAGGPKCFQLNNTAWHTEQIGWAVDPEQEPNLDQSGFGPARLDLMKLAVKFAESGLTEFMGGVWVWGSESRQILEELWASTSTLEVLFLEGFDFTQQSLRREIWNKATMCSSLRSFSLSGPKERRDGDDYDFYDWGDSTIAEGLDVSLGSAILKMYIKSFNMSWEQIAGLVNGLEKFSIGFRGSLSKGLGLFSSRCFKTMILNFKDTLKSLELSGIDCRQDIRPDSQIDLLFPNLESLSLDNVQHIVMKFLSSLKSPKLQSLSIKSHRDAAAAFEILVSLLKRYDAQLTEVVCGSNRDGVANTKEVLSFQKLEKLSIQSGDQSIVDFFSRFDYPNLTQIQPASLKQRFEKVAPKLNQKSDGNEVEGSEIQCEA